MSESSTLILLPLIPLLGAVSCWIPMLPVTLVRWIASGVCLCAFGVALSLFPSASDIPTPLAVTVFEWVKVGGLSLNFRFELTPLTAVMTLLVTGVGTLIHIYSIGYISSESDIRRFFSYLNLFIFFMLVLVLSTSLPILFFGWEGVGLASYLLVGFWYSNEEFAKAGMKAFIVNRVGDVCFIAGMLFLWTTCQALDFDSLARVDQTIADEVFPIVAVLLFLAVSAKSAQFPLYVWLPDAMAGPTPVSALIHAATMVTAGVFLMARVPFIFDTAEELQWLFCLTALITSLGAATIAVVVTDIKKVLAYSTISQLGFMVAAAAAGAYSIAIFHVVTHACFKAALFLSAGSVIHGTGGEQDMSRLGGLKSRGFMPITMIVYGVSAAALVALFPLAGFYSKHAVIEVVGDRFGFTASLFLTVVSVLTAFYMTRSFLLTFFGSYRGDHHVHESPMVMLIPMVLLGVASCLAGFMLEEPLVSFLSSDKHSAHHTYDLLSGLLASWPGILGIGFGILYYRLLGYERLSSIGTSLGLLSRVPSRLFYVDELYHLLIVRPFDRFSHVSSAIVDKYVIDGIVEGLGISVLSCGELVRSMYSGVIGHYLVQMFIGFLFLLAFYLVF